MTHHTHFSAGALVAAAVDLLQQGQFDQAAARLETVLRQIPSHADAHHLMGIIAMQTGRNEEAVHAIARAISVNPTVAFFHNNLSHALIAVGQCREAKNAAERALALEPHLPEAHFNRGQALVGLGKLAAALTCFSEALRLRPGHIEAQFARGVALAGLGRAAEAEAAFRQVLALNPNHAGALNNLAVTLVQMRKFSEALDACDRALVLAPGYSHAHNCRGNALKGLHRYEAALAAVDHALQLHPDYADAHYNRANILLTIGESADAESAFRRALDLKPDDARLHSNLLFLQAARVSLPDNALLKAMRGWEEKHRLDGESTGEISKPVNPLLRRLRIGYVSPHFRSHVLSFFFEPLLAAHDRAQFEVFCYATFPESRADDTTERLRNMAEHWRYAGELTDAELATAVRKDGVDILIDLAGHTSDHRLQAFTLRPAPVQATYLGFFATTGLSAMDYWITDEVLHPLDTGEMASERILRLPRCWVSYRAPDIAPAVSSCPNLGEEVTFGVFSNLSKLTPSAVETWCEILKALPKSRLLLMAGPLRDPMVRARLQARFTECGVSVDRLILRPGGSYKEYFSTYAEVDIVLDPFPRTGGTTTAEALWMGVPVVTLAGRRYVERISASKLVTLGLQELIANSRENYVALAVGLAGDPKRRKSLRSDLRVRIQNSELSDGAGLARAIEELYRDMWSHYVN